MGVADEGNTHRRRGDAVFIGEVNSQQTKDHRNDDLAKHLGPTRKSQGTLLVSLNEVINEPNQAQTSHQEQHKNGRQFNGGAREERCEEIRNHHANHDDNATHGGGALLGVVSIRSTITDELAPAHAAEDTNEDRSHQEGEKQRECAGEK